MLSQSLGTPGGAHVAPVVVVGAGAAGLRVVRDLLRLAPRQPVVLIGEEACEPYDRVRLSAVLAGECTAASLDQSAAIAGQAKLQRHLGEAVTWIDRTQRIVRLRSGLTVPYRALVLALGSRAHVPDIIGKALPGVYTFRDLRDAEHLSARRMRSRRTIVLGGGLLGLEAARAMHRFHTQVVVVEHGGRLMPRQLDEGAAALLERQIRGSGIEVIVDDGVVQILGSTSVTGVLLRSGRRLDGDTVVIATGIVPNTRLAMDAGLPIGRGIKVDDQLRTSDPHIFAIGECAEHRGVVYGLVAPCLEQAAVVASALSGAPAQYVGSIDATRLKVMKTPVFAAGVHPDRSVRGRHHEVVYRRQDGSAYRKLVYAHGALCGLLGVGDWDELPRALEAVQAQRALGWWQRRRFARTGRLWAEQAASTVANWPATATVCNCAGVTRGQLSDAIRSGCSSRAALAAATRASTVCGSCVPLLEQLLGGQICVQPAWGWRALGWMAGLCALAAVLISLLPGLGYLPRWSDAPLHWDVLWRDGLIKQISGFTLLGLALFGLLISLRKRVSRIRLAPFGLWRNLHVAIGLVAILVLLVHTGARLGSGLDAMLMSSFLALSVAGAVAGALIAGEHRLAPAQAKRMRGTSTWLHVLAFWPLPVLLGFHVLKTYYY